MCAKIALTKQERSFYTYVAFRQKRKRMKRVNGHHRQNDTSVLELDTPIQNYKEAYGQEAYEQATSFYESEEWKKV